MVRADPKLSAMMKVIDHERTIRHLVTGAELKIIAADSQTLGGVKAGFVLIDELWLFGKSAKAEAMLEEATGGLASRPEGFVVILTTHSDEPPTGVLKDKLDYFRGVRDGEIDDPTCFGMLYEWPEDARGAGVSEAGEFLCDEPEPGAVAVGPVHQLGQDPQGQWRRGR
jgi:phage terminase large subunit-like protein